MIPGPFILPSVKYRNKLLFFFAGLTITGLASWYIQFNPFGFFSEFHYVRDLLNEMFLPNFGILLSNVSVARSIFETLSMAFLGTLYGSLFALILAFLAASNTMPSKGVALLAGFIIACLRGIPSLVVILIFVIAVGLGAFAGVLTLVVITVGTFGKLFSEMIESAETAPSDAILSVGASRLQVIRFSIVPQLLPAFIANLLYAFDVNLRTAIALGIFGGGGIGFQLYMAMHVLHYKDAMAIIIFTTILVVLIEKISDRLRLKILGEGKI